MKGGFFLKETHTAVWEVRFRFKKIKYDYLVMSLFLSEILEHLKLNKATGERPML